MALRWHPDNFKYSKKAAEKKFIEVAAAKEVLTDPGTNYFLNSINTLLVYLFQSIIIIFYRTTTGI